MSLNHQKAIEIIAKIEEQFDVNSLLYQDLKVWPLIRLSLWNQLLHPKASQSTWTKKPKNSQSVPFQKNYTSYLNAVRLHYKQLEPLHYISPIDTLCFSRLEDHSDRFSGKFYNRHIDPITDLLKNQYSYVKLELSATVNARLPRFEPTIFFDPIYFLSKENLIEQSSPVRDLGHISNFEEFQKKALEITSGVVIEEITFVQQTQMLERYSKFFTDILTALRPKTVFLVCYYYILAMALIRACKKLEITTVDIQHGKQGKYHGLYTHWTCIPPEGYELLPDIFWSWGRSSQENIQKWKPIGCHHHKPIIGGNCWLSKWVEGNGLKLDREVQDFINWLQSWEKVILVSLQPIEKPLPKHLIQAMQQSSQHWLWLLRLHPLRKYQKQQFQTALAQQNIKNFELDRATDLPLYALLQKSHHHVTAYSSVCYEALAFGVPTTIIHDSGLKLYDDYICQGLFDYADTREALVESIQRNNSCHHKKETVPYVETSQKIAKSTLASIFEKSW